MKNYKNIKIGSRSLNAVADLVKSAIEERKKFLADNPSFGKTYPHLCSRVENEVLDLESVLKQIKTPDVEPEHETYQGYIARDQMGTLSLFLHDMPHKQYSEVGQGEWLNDTWDGVAIPGRDFQSVEWDDREPRCVKITVELI